MHKKIFILLLSDSILKYLKWHNNETIMKYEKVNTCMTKFFIPMQKFRLALAFASYTIEIGGCNFRVPK